MQTSTKPFIKRKFEKIALLTIMFFASIAALAQDNEPIANISTDVTTTTTTEQWTSNPIYWVIGALVLIIIVALITRGNKK